MRFRRLRVLNANMLHLGNNSWVNDTHLLIVLLNVIRLNQNRQKIIIEQIM